MIEKWRERAIEVLNLCNKNKKYIAMNKENQWTIYSNKPKLYRDDGWGWNGEFPIHISDFIDMIPAPNWEESLIERLEVIDSKALNQEKDE